MRWLSRKKAIYGQHRLYAISRHAQFLNLNCVFNYFKIAAVMLLAPFLALLCPFSLFIGKPAEFAGIIGPAVFFYFQYHTTYLL